MKLLATLLFSLLLCGPATFAATGPLGTGTPGTVYLAWPASPTADVEGVSNYVIYASSGTNRVRVEVGTNLTASVSDLVSGVWTFAATAMGNQRVESLPGGSLNVQVPTSPGAVQVVALQYSGTLTNFYDVGFFKLRLP